MARVISYDSWFAHRSMWWRTAQSALVTLDDHKMLCDNLMREGEEDHLAIYDVSLYETMRELPTKHSARTCLDAMSVADIVFCQ